MRNLDGLAASIAAMSSANPWGVAGRPLTRADLERIRDRVNEFKVCQHVVAPTGGGVRMCVNCFQLVEVEPGAMKAWVDEVVRRMREDTEGPFAELREAVDEWDRSP